MNFKAYAEKVEIEDYWIKKIMRVIEYSLDAHRD